MERNLDPYISADKIDELLEVTNSRGWIALFGLSLLIVGSIIWIFFGQVPLRVYGVGMLIDIGGIHAINSYVNGKVEKINVNVGDLVSQHQPIANIIQPSLLKDIHNMQEKIQGQRLLNHQKERQRTTLTTKYQEEIVELKKLQEMEQKLLKSGATTGKDILDITQRLVEEQKKLGDLSVDQLVDSNELSRLEGELQTLQKMYEFESLIRSPYDGVIVEIEQIAGNVVQVGARLVTVDTHPNATSNLEGIIYIPATDGKRVKNGMEARIIPSTVKAQEYGSILGKISYVSQYPVTEQRMLQVLQNEGLVKEILAQGSKIEVHVELLTSKSTISGFKWTTKKGVPYKIHSGALSQAKISVQVKKPVELIVPKIKEWVGIDS